MNWIVVCTCRHKTSAGESISPSGCLQSKYRHKSISLLPLTCLWRPSPALPQLACPFPCQKWLVRISYSLGCLPCPSLKRGNQTTGRMQWGVMYRPGPPIHVSWATLWVICVGSIVGVIEKNRGEMRSCGCWCSRWDVVMEKTSTRVTHPTEWRGGEGRQRVALYKCRGALSDLHRRNGQRRLMTAFNRRSVTSS